MPDQDRARLAREALARAKADARARGSVPAPVTGQISERKPAPDPSTSGMSLATDGQMPAERAGLSGPSARQRGDPGGSPPRGNAALPRGNAALPRGNADPEPLNRALEALIDERGWREAAAGGSVFSRWAEIVGPDLAAHTRPDGLADGELTVTADSTAWATQVRLLAPELVRKFAVEVGDGVVRRVWVRGPAAAAGPRRPGQWRVRGSRGPRDTYG